MSNIIHAVGSYPLLVGIFSQFVVLYGAAKSGEKPAIVQAILLILALGSTAVSIALRPHSPPQLLPDLLGCTAAAFLLTPAVVTVRKLLTKEGAEK